MNFNSALIFGANNVIVGLDQVVDGYTGVQHRLRTRIGNEPIQEGTSISDHAESEPDVVALIGWVSNFNGINRPVEAFGHLRRIMKALTIVTVITEWHTYRSAIIIRADASTRGRGMRLELEIQEVRFVPAPAPSYDTLGFEEARRYVPRPFVNRPNPYSRSSVPGLAATGQGESALTRSGVLAPVSRADSEPSRRTAGATILADTTSQINASRHNARRYARQAAEAAALGTLDGTREAERLRRQSTRQIRVAAEVAEQRQAEIDRGFVLAISEAAVERLQEVATTQVDRRGNVNDTRRQKRKALAAAAEARNLGFDSEADRILAEASALNIDLPPDAQRAADQAAGLLTSLGVP